jgi:hypothetical protein
MRLSGSDVIIFSGWFKLVVVPEQICSQEGGPRPRSGSFAALEERDRLRRPSEKLGVAFVA